MQVTAAPFHSVRLPYTLTTPSPVPLQVQYAVVGDAEDFTQRGRIPFFDVGQGDVTHR